ncbi:MAG: aminoacyl-tRNA hydrolase [Thermoflexales bacterium]|nr:aminoacyl-tRNA hydrolase [Thermoflexales bacterium]MDW8352494.1 alternative ribosome rescue aminoacyl-tRNA hydrolase ArfB [Anaerolineae bacterium]
MATQEQALIINARVRIPLDELKYRFSRAAGAGGQHVNKTETAVELLFDLARTPSLNEAQRQRAMARLARYLDGQGILHLEARNERSQLRNREQVTRRFVQLMRQALAPTRIRRKTRPPRYADEARLRRKRRIGEIKRQRRAPALD